MIISPSSNSLRVILAASLIAATILPGSAQTTYTWNSGSAGSWNDSSKWDANGVPVAGGLNSIAFSPGAIGADFSANNNLGNSFDLGSLTLGGSGSGGNRALTISGNSLDFQGAANTISFNSANSLRYVISAGINFSGGLLLNGSNTSGSSSQISGNISGSGGLIKEGSGRINISASSNDDNNWGSTTLRAGTLLAGANGALGVGQLVLEGGTLSYSGTFGGIARQLNNASVLFSADSVRLINKDVQGGVNLVFNASTIDLGGSAARVILVERTNSTTLAGESAVFSGVVSNGGFIKDGVGGITLSNAANLYAGDTVVRQGSLNVANNAASGSGVLGTATSDIQLGDASSATATPIAMNITGGFTVARNITVNNNNATGTTIIGGTNAAGTTSTYSGGITLNKGVTLRSTTAGATTEFTGVINDGAGSFGITTLGAGVVILGSATGNTYDGGTTVATGTTLKVANTSGSATGSGAVTVEAGGTLTGGGSIDSAVNMSGTISPGNSPGVLATGSETWNPGGHYNWQIFDATGDAGVGYDTLQIDGILALDNLDGVTLFNINLWSLSAILPSDVNGNAINFDNSITQFWTLASTTGGITGFAASDFVINVAANNGTGGFTNDLGEGEFSVAVVGNDLRLQFTVIPEPNAALLAGAATLLALGFRRRRG